MRAHHNHPCQTRPRCSSLAYSQCQPQQKVCSARGQETCSQAWGACSPAAMSPMQGWQAPDCQGRRQSRVCSTSLRASPAPEAKTVVQVEGSQLRLIHPLKVTGPRNKIMVFIPGTDGTGQAILPHVHSLQTEGGYDVYCLATPPQDRSDWPELTRAVTALLAALLKQLKAQTGRDYRKVTLFGESFGGVLALRVGANAAGLVEDIILLNPATCFSQSLSGITSVVSSTNLLSLFPPVLYRVAQATLLPLLVDSRRLGPEGMDRMRSMIDMTPAVHDSDGYPASAEDSASSDRRAGLQLPETISPSSIAATANFRANLMREGSGLPDSMLAAIHIPVLLLSSAKDRMLPSMQEGARLQRVLPNARRVILPESGHAALLEDDLPLLSILRASANLRPGAPPERQAAAAVLPSLSELGNGSSNGNGNGRSSKRPKQVAAAAAEAQEAGQLSTVNGAPVGENGGAAGRYRGEMDGHQMNSWDEWSQILAPWRDLVSPVLLGFENLPALDSPDASRPMLFVGNHQRVGFYDTPLLVYELAMRGYRMRGLAHPGHWSGPVGPFFEKFGAVKASPMAAYRLLKNNEKVLLFPGGAKEVVKPKGTDYQLFWKDAPDFVRLAAKCNAIIIPFAAVGADDAYNVLMDTEDVLDHPMLGPMARAFYAKVAPDLNVHDAVMPLTGLPGIGLPTPIPIPNLNRLYFKIAPPIDTAALNLNLRDTKAVNQLYTDVRTTVEQNIADLLVYRSADEEEGVVARLGKALSTWATLVVDTATLAPEKESGTASKRADIPRR